MDYFTVVDTPTMFSLTPKRFPFLPDLYSKSGKSLKGKLPRKQKLVLGRFQGKTNTDKIFRELDLDEG